MLLAASVVALTVRMLVSLAVVLVVIGAAYLVARRRAGGTRVRSARPGRRPRVVVPGRRTADRGSRHGAGLEVVGRVGLTRGSAAVAVRFGDRVVLLAAGETGQATVVAEMPSTDWDDRQIIREPLELPGRPVAPEPGERPSLVEALRIVTARRPAAVTERASGG